MFPCSHNDPIVMYVGRLNRAKKLDLLLRAAANATDRGQPVNVLLIGDGDAIDDLSALAKTLSIADRFLTPGVL